MTLVHNHRPLLGKAILASSFMLVILACFMVMADRVSAHGYVESPASRGYLCKLGTNTDCGAVVYEPQSLETTKGFPAAGLTDGKFGSANGIFPKLDEQSSTRWSKVNVTSGQTTFTWKFTANHATTDFRYFMTKSTWNPNSPLTRDQFDLVPFCTYDMDGAQPPFTLSHTCDIPQRTGYHVILAVWDVDNTANAFYNTIDVQFGTSSGGDTTAPSAPAGVSATNIGTTSATVSWNAASDNVGVTGYRVFNGSTQIGSTTGALSLNLTGLTSSTTYNITVKAVDAAGNVSASSNTASFTTLAVTAPDTTAPTAPSGLHVMGSPTASSMMLMWNASTDNVGVTGYRIYNGSALVATVNGTTTDYTVTGLSAGTTYSFSVRAIDAAGNQSAASTISGTTAPAGNGGTAPAWAPGVSYTAGTLVTYNGATYECRQAHTSLTGWEPSNVPALWLLK